MADFYPTTRQALIDAIHAANTNNEADTIYLGGLTFTFTAPFDDTQPIPDPGSQCALPDFSSEITLDGQGGTIERDAETASQFRFFRVNGSTGQTDHNVTIKNLTFRNGSSLHYDGPRRGGAIIVYGGDYTGILSFYNVDFYNNRAEDDGGAIQISDSATSTDRMELYLENCGFYGNYLTDAYAGTGAVKAYYADLVTVINCRFENNMGSSSDGYGLEVADAITAKNLIIHDSYFAHNGSGDEQFNTVIHTGSGTVDTAGLLIRNSIFYQNEGMAIFNRQVNPDVQFCEFEGNGSAIVHWSTSSNNYAQFNAPNNYWGSADGPSGSGPGTGDTVSDNVIYSPWLGASDPAPHDGDNTYPFTFTDGDASLNITEKKVYETDLRLAVASGQMSFTRIYRSHHQDDFQFMGSGWTHNHHVFLGNVGNDTIYAYLPGVILKLEKDGNDEYRQIGSAVVVTEVATDQYLLVNADKSQYSFEVKDSSRPDIAQLISIEYPTGQIWTYDYDPTDHRLSAVTDSYGHGLQFSYYNSATFKDGLLERVAYHDTNAGWVDLEYTDDGTGEGLLTLVTDERDEMWTYTYHDSGAFTNFLYQRKAPAIGTGTPIIVEEVTYEGTPDKITKMTIKRGDEAFTEVIAYEYDAEDKIIGTKRYVPAAPTFLEEQVFENGVLKESINGAGDSIRYGHPLFMHVSSTTDARGNSINYRWDSSRQLAAISGPRRVEGYSGALIETILSYDSEDRVKTIQDGTGVVTEYTYDSGEQPSKIKLYDNYPDIYSDVEFDYDSEGRLTERRVMDNGTAVQITSYHYRIDNGLLDYMVVQDLEVYGELAGLAMVTTHAYDSIGQLIKVEKSSMYGTCEYTYLVYDAGGLLIGQACGVHNASSDVLTLFDLDALYDANDAKKQYTRISKFEYDEMGRRILIRRNCHTIATERQTRLVYDAFNRVIMSIENYDGTASPENWVWESNQWRTASGGAAINHGAENDMNIISRAQYNARNLPRWQQDRAGMVTLYGYDAADRNVKTVVNASNPGYNNDYDGDASLSLYTESASAEWDMVLEQAYDANGNVIEITRHNSDEANQVTRIDYDEANLPIRITENPLTEYEISVDSSRDVITENLYDAVGRVVEERRLIGGNDYFSTRMVYDGAGRTIAVIVNYTGILLSNLLIGGSTGPDENLITRFSYDAQGNLLETIAPDNSVTRYIYNSVNQLEAVIANCTINASYVDWNGSNWVYDGGTVNHGSLNDENIITRYEYEADNNSPDLGRLRQQTLVDGVIERIVYDTTGRTFRRIASYVDDQVTNPQNWSWDATTQTWNSSSGTPVARGNNADDNLIQDFSYDNEDRLIQVRDHLGNLRRIVYDKLNRSIKTIANYEPQNGSDPASWYVTASSWLDGTGQSINHGSEHDQNLIEALHYDLRGNVDRVWDTKGQESRLFYDSRGLLIQQIENYAAGGQSSSGNDNLDQNLSTTFSYDKLGRLLSVYSPEDNLARYVYDRLNRIVEVQRVANGVVYSQQTDYDKLGNVTQVRHGIAGNSRVDQRISYQYDGALRPATITDGAGQLTQLSYNHMGSVVEMIDPAGNRTHYFYDGLQRNYRIIQNYDEVTANPENWLWEGNQWRVSSGGSAVNHGVDKDMNIVVHLRYAPNGDVLEIQAPAGDHALYGYDKLGRQVSTQNAAGFTWFSQFEASNRSMRRQMTYPGINSTTAAAYTVTEQMDRAGRPASIQYGDPANTPDVRFAFDVADNLELMQEYSGANFSNLHRQTRTSYDKMDRPVLMEFDENGNGSFEESIAYAYNRNGQRIRMSLPEGNDRYSFDAAGQLQTLTDRFGQVTTMQGYNASGYPGKIQRVSEQGILLDSDYDYDLAGRLKTLSHGSNQQPAQTLAKFAYDYDSRGNRIKATEFTAAVMVTDSLTYADPEVTDVAGLWQDNGSGGIYSDSLDAALVMTFPGNTTQVRLKYAVGSQYGAMGIFVDGIPYQQVYTYNSDDLDRSMLINLEAQTADHIIVLLNVAETASRRRIEFNSLDLLASTPAYLTKNYSYDALSRLQSANSQSFDYDVAGNLVNMNGVTRTFNVANQMTNDGTGTLQYDPNGNLILDSAGNSYTWDRANRLIGYNNDTYGYDGQGNRRWMTEQISGQTRRKDFLLDLMAPYPTIQRETVHLDGAPQTADTQHYVHGLSGIQTSYLNGASSYMLQDGLGSVRMHANNLAVPTYTNDFSPYGYGTFDGYGFTGEYSDLNGLLYLRARYYHPAQGVFLSRDSYPGQVGLPMTRNRYAYGNGNPVIYRDPSGHVAILAAIAAVAYATMLGLAIGAVVGTGISYGMQVYGNVKDDGFQLRDLVNINWGRVGVDALEGAIIGAIGGAFGAGIALAGLSGGAAFLLGFGIDAAIGTAWDMNVRGDSFGTALTSNLIFAGAFEGVSHVAGRGVRGALRSMDINLPRLRTGADVDVDVNARTHAEPQRVGGCASFSEDTIVQTPDGEKAISDLWVGDAIMGYNENSGEVDVFLVEATHRQVHETTLDVTIDGELIHTTDEHPFMVYVDEALYWTEAQQLNMGDKVLAADGRLGTVEAVTVVDEPQTMYNLTVSLVATYLVGEQGWVVHNIEICDLYRGVRGVEPIQRVHRRDRLRVISETGHILSEFAQAQYIQLRQNYQPHRALYEAFLRTFDQHISMIDSYGGISKYVLAHQGDKVSNLDRTLISFTTPSLHPTAPQKPRFEDISRTLERFGGAENLFVVKNVNITSVDDYGIFDNRVINWSENEILVPIMIPFTSHFKNG